MNFRQPALEVLRLWDTSPRFASSLVDEVCHAVHLPPRDRSALQRLVFAVIRNNHLLQFWAKRLAHGRLDPKTLRLAKMGIAELILLQESPHAAVSETVKLAGWAKGLLNALLHHALREAPALLEECATLPPPLRWSIPPFLWVRWCLQHGEEAAAALCQWNHLPAPVFLRLNSLLHIPDEVRSSPLLQPLSSHPGFFEVQGTLPVSWFEEGWVYAQDPSTAPAIALLDPRPGQRILDACAAPGGKSFAISALTRNLASLTATDLSNRRLRLLKENFRRLHVQAQVFQGNWTSPLPPAPGPFDRILLDAPCSNTGVIRRRIDVPHRLSPDDFTSLPQLQLRLLQSLAPLLAPGGRLVYSTCSIDATEGPLLVDRFLQENPGFDKVSEVFTRPWVDGLDGAYAVSLEISSATVSLLRGNPAHDTITP